MTELPPSRRRSAGSILPGQRGLSARIGGYGTVQGGVGEQLFGTELGATVLFRIFRGRSATLTNMDPLLLMQRYRRPGIWSLPGGDPAMPLGAGTVHRSFSRRSQLARSETTEQAEEQAKSPNFHIARKKLLHFHSRPLRPRLNRRHGLRDCSHEV